MRVSGLTTAVRDFWERLPVWLRWREARFVLVALYWLNFCLMSLSMAERSFCRLSISSPMGLSARYLTLFQWKDWR